MVGFKIKKNYYLYDRYSNNVIQINKLLFKCLDDIIQLNIKETIRKYNSEFKKQEIQEAYELVNIYQNDYNAIKPFKQILNFSNISYYNNLINNNSLNKLSTLFLSLTDNCNFSCSYCYYTSSNTREYYNNSKYNMTWINAKKAIDFFLSDANNFQPRYISISGGEALINYTLIKKIIDYINKKDNNISITITTNGSLLNSDIIKYFIKNKVKLVISLDGPKEVHDKNRRLLNSKGTYDQIIKNINYIKENFNEFFKNNVTVNSVITPHNKIIEKLNKFFNSNDFPINYHAERVSLSNHIFYKKNNYLKFYDKYTDNFLKHYKKTHINGFNSMSDIPLFFTSNEIHKFMLSFHWRSSTPFDEETIFWPDGLCIPGLHKLFVSTSGDFYPCNKLFYQNKMKIGDINEGINGKAIQKYIYSYLKDMYNHCNNCWALRLCKVCYKDFIFDTNGNKVINPDYCKLIRNQIIKIITAYVEIIEMNSKAFSLYTRA